jgi:hypothetical protein
MEWTWKGYELTLTIQRKRRKGEQASVRPVAQHPMGGRPATQRRRPFTTGFSHIVPPR